MRSTDQHDQACRLAALGEVAQIQPGYLSRSGVRSVASGTHRLLQAKDVSPDFGLRPNEAVQFNPKRKPELYEVSRGDILVAARGLEHHAVLVTSELRNTLASHIFYILRPDQNLVRPAYLAWWLNLAAVQAQINADAAGTNIGYVSRQAMERIPVTVPPAEVQFRIERITELSRTQKELQTQLNQKREQLQRAVCLRAVRQTEEE